MSRPDPNQSLARRHSRHASPQLGCPICMRDTAPLDRLPRWARPRAGVVR